MWSPPLGVVGAGAATAPADTRFHQPTRDGASAYAGGANIATEPIVMTTPTMPRATRCRPGAVTSEPPASRHCWVVASHCLSACHYLPATSGPVRGTTRSREGL